MKASATPGLHARHPEFSARLTNSDPVLLPNPPFGGDYRRAGVLFHLGRVRSARIRWNQLVGSLEKKRKEILRGQVARTTGFFEEWQGRQAEDGFDMAYAEWQVADNDDQVAALTLQSDIQQRLFRWIVAGLVEVETDEHGDSVCIDHEREDAPFSIRAGRPVWRNKDGEVVKLAEDEKPTSDLHMTHLINLEADDLTEQVDELLIEWVTDLRVREEVITRFFLDPLSWIA